MSLLLRPQWLRANISRKKGRLSRRKYSIKDTLRPCRCHLVGLVSHQVKPNVCHFGIWITRRRCAKNKVELLLLYNSKILPSLLDCPKDTVAEWLRRGPAKLVRSACASSNLVGVENFFCTLCILSYFLNIKYLNNKNVWRLEKLRQEKRESNQLELTQISIVTTIC